MKKTLLVVIAWYLFTFPAVGQDTLVLQDMKHAWTPLDQGAERFLIRFELPVLAANEALMIRSEEPVDIWINAQLGWHQFDSTLFLDASALAPFGTGSYWIQLFSSGGIEEDALVTRLIRIVSLPREEVAGSSSMRTADQAGYLIILTILLLLLGIYRHFFPITFNQSIQNPLSHKIRSFSADKTYVTFGSVDNLFSLFFFGGLATLIFGYLGYGLELWTEDSVGRTLTNWVLGSIVVSLVLIGKYVWARFVAFVYQFRGIPNIQVQDFVHFFTLILLIGAGMSLIDFSSTGHSGAGMENFIIYLMILSLIFFQVWFFLKFDKFHTHRKLMIFSYLCTTEFLPGFLAIYWLMKL